MNKKINIYLIILTLIAIISTALLSALVFYEVQKKEVIKDLKTYTQLMAATDAWNIATEPEKSNDLLSGKDTSDLRVTFIAPDGRAVFDTNVSSGNMENHSQRPEIIEAFRNGSGQAVRKSATMKKNTFYYAMRLDNGYVLRAARESGSITGIFISAFIPIACICVALFLLCLFISHILTKSIIKPISNLSKNFDSFNCDDVYPELKPFVATIKSQHDDIIRNSTIRQDFTANVSHELKTPLTSISGYAELIENGMTNEKQTQRFAGEIRKSSKRLLTLINDTIRLSQLDSMSKDDIFEEVDIYDVAASCVNNLKMYAAQHNVNIVLTGKHSKVYANAKMMDELINNLCDNAIRYNNPNGSVIVDVQLNKNDNKTIVTIKDTGIGISKENQERVFERFYRVDKSRSKSTGGTGLGLAIVKHIVASHNGLSLSMNSEEGKGTTIILEFVNKGSL